GRDGRLYVVWDDFSNNPNYSEIKIDSSTDGGRTWGTDQTVATTPVSFDGRSYIIPAQRYGIRAVPSLGVATTGPNAGRLYVAYPTSGGGAEGSSTYNDTDIMLAYSNDPAGTTGSWTSVRVNDDTGTNSQFLPWVDLDRYTGNVLVSWFDARNDRN